MIVSLHQRVEDLEEGQQAILDAWHEQRERIGLGIPASMDAASRGALRVHARRFLRGDTSREAYNAMMDYPFRRQICGFHQDLQEPDFGEWSMLIRDRLSIQPALRYDPESESYQLAIAGVMAGACPAN